MRVLHRVETSDASHKTSEWPKSSSLKRNKTKTSTKFVRNRAGEPRIAQPWLVRGDRNAARDPQPGNAQPWGCPTPPPAPLPLLDAQEEAALTHRYVLAEGNGQYFLTGPLSVAMHRSAAAGENKRDQPAFPTAPRALGSNRPACECVIVLKLNAYFQENKHHAFHLRGWELAGGKSRAELYCQRVPAIGRRRRRRLLKVVALVIKAFRISAITRARTKPARHKTAVSVYNGIKLERAGTRLRGGQTKRGSPRCAPARTGRPTAASHGSQPPGSPSSPDPLGLQAESPEAELPALLPHQHLPNILPSLFGFVVRWRAGGTPEQPRQGWGQQRGPGCPGSERSVPRTAHQIPQDSLCHPACSPANCQSPQQQPAAAPSTGHSSDPCPSSASKKFCSALQPRAELTWGVQSHQVPVPPFAPVPWSARRVRNGCSSPGSGKAMGHRAAGRGKRPGEPTGK